MVSVPNGVREGYALITDPYGGVQESSTFNCCHCQFVVIVHAGSGVERGYCWLCNSPTCGKKSCNSNCVPFMKRIEAAENRARLHRVIEAGCDNI
jgi:hypothetical protein